MLVGIYSDRPQSGKSTVKEAFVKKGFIAESFATPVKESLLVVLKALKVVEPERYLWGDWKNKVIRELGVTGGSLMSTFATDYFRDTVNTDVWLKALLLRLDPEKDYVIDDMRFPNEFDIFDYVIKVVRQDAPQHDRSKSSEGLLSGFPFNFVLYNDGDLNELERYSIYCADRIIKTWGENV